MTVSNNIPNGLDKQTINTLTELTDLGFSIAVLKMNRVINPTTVSKKEKSIVKSGGIISPSMIVSAQVCIDSNLEIELSDGTTVTESTPNIDKIVVCIDGSHRAKAISNLNDSDKHNFENYYIFPQCTEIDLIVHLQECNSVIKVWSSGDYIVSLLNKHVSSKVDLSKLNWFRVLVSNRCTEISAWRWSNLNNDKFPTKSQICRATQDDAKAIEELEKIAILNNFSDGKKLYDTLARPFSGEVLGLKIIPEFFINKIAELEIIDKSRNEAFNIVYGFASSLKHDDADKIKNTKSDKGIKTGGTGRSRDAKIIAMLKKLYNQYMSSKN